MKIKIIFTLFVIMVLAGFFLFNFTNIAEKSPVMNIELVIKGNYSHPIIDAKNTTRSIELIPILKQPRQTPNPPSSAILYDVFYDQRKIAYGGSVPYHGVGNYSISIAFVDDAKLPNYNNESVMMWLRFTSNNKIIRKQYTAFRWVNLTELQ